MMAQPLGAAELAARQKPQGAVDPNIKVPQQVRDAGRRAEIIQNAALGIAEPTVLPDGQTPPNGAAPAAPAPTPSEPPVDWERQFKSLQGRFDQQRDAISQMSTRITSLEGENSSLRTQVR